MNSIDVVVIGAGSGGLTAAVGFANVGKKVLLVEREHMGGECTNSGCIPSKALLHHAKTYHHAITVAGKSPKATRYRREAMDYVQSKIASVLRHETPEAFRALGINVILGEASFRDEHTIVVNNEVYTFKTAVIATGSAPRMITIPGLRTSDVLTNQNIFTLSEPPEKLLVIGSGPIGMEMGQALAMLGSDVTIATIDSALGRLEDPAIRPILSTRFAELGIKVELRAHIDRVENGAAIFHRKDPDENQTSEVSVHFDKVLLAIGRVSNLPAGLEHAGIATSDQGIVVDSQYRTSNKYVYAVGDVAQSLKFTHTADDSARQVVTRVASKGLLRVNRGKAVPKVTYTSPEVAQVGLSFESAQEKYQTEQLLRIEVPFSKNDRALTDDQTEGLLVVVARRLSGAVLGANIIGTNAGELITPFTLAIDNKLSLWKLRRTIYAYPTYSLLIKKAGDQFLSEQVASLKPDLLALLKRHALKLIAGLVWLILLISLYRYQSNQAMSTTDTALMIFDFITMTTLGPLVYILFYAIRPITFFPATALTILAGIFFGLVWGTILTIIAATLSAAVAYSVGRFFGTGLRLEDSAIGNWVTALRHNTFEAILTMRLIFLPFDGVSYLAGIIRINFLPFLTATTLGILLGTATFVSIGASLDISEFKMDGFSFNILEPKFLALSAGIFIASLGLSKLLKRWQVVKE